MPERRRAARDRRGPHRARGHRGRHPVASARGWPRALKAADAGRARPSATVADARFAKPLDRDLILRSGPRHEALITVEEGAIGGFGASWLQLLAEEGALDAGLKVRSMVLPDRFIDQDTPARMYAAAAMNAEHIEAKILALMDVARIGRCGPERSLSSAPGRPRFHPRQRFSVKLAIAGSGQGGQLVPARRHHIGRQGL